MERSGMRNPLLFKALFLIILPDLINQPACQPFSRRRFNLVQDTYHIAELAVNTKCILEKVNFVSFDIAV